MSWYALAVGHHPCLVQYGSVSGAISITAALRVILPTSTASSITSGEYTKEIVVKRMFIIQHY